MPHPYRSGARVVLARSFFRARFDRFRDEDDVFRVRELEDGWLVAMANAFDSGFATCFPEGSRLLLDELTKALDTNGPRAAFEIAARAFAAAEPPLPRDEDFPDEKPAASVTIAVVRPDEVRCFHRGVESVAVVERGSVEHRLATDDLRSRLYAHRLESASELPEILVDLVRDGRARPDETMWCARAGMSVWVLSGSLRSTPGDALTRPTWPEAEELASLLQRPTYVAGVRLDIVAE